ncbi:hypothetical protein M3_0012 [Lysinibacillus phage vB_LfM_LysYB1]|nr:hypothetical protein M3_0012 [Lysinibacillus phage vB_LfM_LysYB1]WAB25245.1 hypothetical protein M5_0067 [Lysinibacillus phage vB_LfM_LysYB2]
MPQSDGKNTLQRMEFLFDGKSYKFNINPEEYTQDEPVRSTITQTKAGAWVDKFGAGLPQIFMRGTTGFKNGFEKFKELRGFLRKYNDSTTPGLEITKELIFHNFTDGESWIVDTDPSGFKLFRSKSNPLMYMYEIRLTCLRDASVPKEKSSGGIGNPMGSALAEETKTRRESPNLIQ